VLKGNVDGTIDEKAGLCRKGSNGKGRPNRPTVTKERQTCKRQNKETGRTNKNKKNKR